MNNPVPVKLEDFGYDLVAEDFRVTKDELEAIACHHLSTIMNYDYLWHTIEISVGRSDGDFEYWRLECIERILGEDVLKEVLAPVNEHWKKRFADLKVALDTPIECKECGEEFRRWRLDEVLCERCGKSVPARDGPVEGEW